VSQRLSRVAGGGLLQRPAQVTDCVDSKLTILHELRGNVERLTAAVDAGRLSEFDKRMLAFALNLINDGRPDGMASATAIIASLAATVSDEVAPQGWRFVIPIQFQECTFRAFSGADSRYRRPRATGF
jgi:hypothetical protein